VILYSGIPGVIYWIPDFIIVFLCCPGYSIWHLGSEKSAYHRVSCFNPGGSDTAVFAFDKPKPALTTLNQQQIFDLQTELNSATFK